MNPSAEYTPQDVLAVVKDELELAVEHYSAAEYPRAVLLAGQPGAGKTELSSMLLPTLGNNAVLINGDEYRRYHPSYRRLYRMYGAESVSMTAAFSGEVTEKLIDVLSDRRLHLIIEGTGRTADVPKKTAEHLTDKGYPVIMAVIAVKPEVSLASTLLRFYEMNERGTLPRATAVEAHDVVVASLPGNLDKLAPVSAISGMGIWTRTQEKIFDSETAVDPPSVVLRQFWSRPWTMEERHRIRADIRLLFEKEERQRLGQGDVIHELERRVNRAIASEEMKL
ncbi:MAG: zeta toxin family protein [Oscillospiraceae bacterium]|nr:zeta toxin family protein [Oscillospiraceae bacterium]